MKKTYTIAVCLMLFAVSFALTACGNGGSSLEGKNKVAYDLIYEMAKSKLDNPSSIKILYGEVDLKGDKFRDDVQKLMDENKKEYMANGASEEEWFEKIDTGRGHYTENRVYVVFSFFNESGETELHYSSVYKTDPLNLSISKISDIEEADLDDDFMSSNELDLDKINAELEKNLKQKL